MKKALVTGAAGGVGFETARLLRQEGFEVLTLDVKPGCDLEIDIYSSPLDSKIFETIDVIVANAAIVNTVAPSHEMTLSQWERDVNVNLTGAWRTIQACLGGMRARRWGRIIAISSGAAEGGLPGQIAYSASKAGILGMIRTLAVEQAPFGITANAILPGGIATSVFDDVPEDVCRRIIAGIPAGRMGTPEEVAHLIAFLASEPAGYITGESIGIDGGLGLLQVASLFLSAEPGRH